MELDTTKKRKMDLEESIEKQYKAMMDLKESVGNQNDIVLRLTARDRHYLPKNLEPRLLASVNQRHPQYYRRQFSRRHRHRRQDCLFTSGFFNR